MQICPVCRFVLLIEQQQKNNVFLLLFKMLLINKKYIVLYLVVRALYMAGIIVCWCYMYVYA